MVDEKESTTTEVEFTVPEWVNAALIQQALQNSEEKSLQVKNVSVSAGTAPGDNYGSTIYRVKAALSDDSERSFLVKGPAPGEAAIQLAKETGTFQREAVMLAEVVPQIEALLEEVAPGKFPPLAARCPHHGSEPVEFLVLEDLAPAGFKVADRKRGLDFRHSLMAVRALARYHAASHALLRRNPELVEKIPNLSEQSTQTVDTFLATGIQAAADACRTWPGFEEYATLLEKYKPLAASNLRKIYVLKPGAFDVLMHGDFWVNNMMFRYEDGDPKPKSIRLVDFQISTVTSPAVDLLYFLSTSVSDHVSENNEDILIQEYYITLKQTLSLLRLQAPSLEALLADMNARGPYALMGTFNVIPIVRAQRVANLEAAFTGDTSGITSLYEDPAVKKWMQRVLPTYKRKGWLPS